MTCVRLTSSFLILLLIAGSLPADELRILPESATLGGPKATQQLIAQHIDGETVTVQEREVTWTSSDAAIASISSTGVITPHADGEVTITATAGDTAATISVKVQGQEQPATRSFRNHVLPVLSKAGCNMGACHGALAGKGGFRLSLGAYDPQTDYFNIVKQDRGRRIEFADPGRSLLLAKPSGGMPHKGGLRFDTDSLEYQVLADWIATGAASPTDKDPQLQQLEVFPARVTLQSGAEQQMLVRARYSDGRTEDVTRWIKWTSTNETVCTINGSGEVTVIGPGEGAITAWFSSQIVMARITVPYPNQVDAALYAELAPRNFIDEHVNKQLQRLNLPPSPRCTDAEFIRRAYLDTVGLLPTPAEVRTFLTSTEPEKRDKLIEELLGRPEFVDYWSYKWSDVLMLNGTLLRPEALKAYYTWIRGHVEKNTPWNEFVSEILTSTGSSYENGSTNFFALNQTPEDMTENACQSFLSLSIGCAKCHNHPLEKWTNDQYYAMANMFSRVRAKGWGGETRNGNGLRTLYVVESGELVQPRTGKPQPPTPLDGTPLAFDDPADRRIQLADWLTAPENPYFARAITNRIWANYLGVGLVDAEDDMRATNPASNEELLAASAQHLIENKFDVKSLMRAILQSATYQRSSQPLPENAAEQRFYSRYYPRRLMAEVLHDAVAQSTDVPTKFDFVAFPGADKQKTEFYPLGTRAVQLYDSAVESYFLEAFGRNPRNIVCECERSDEPSMVQVLHISNGSTINDKLSAESGRVSALLALQAEGMSIDSLVDEVFLQCLSRFPTPRERQQTLDALAEAPEAEKRLAIEDLFWALLSSREFLFNH